jgi:putative transposase
VPERFRRSVRTSEPEVHEDYVSAYDLGRFAESARFVRTLHRTAAVTKPRPSLATLHRLAVSDARQRNAPVPGYSTVRDIVLALDPGLVTLALQGPASYRDRQ